MTVFKCKMCGGTLEINNETVATCEYCGTQQTLPKLDDERKANLYDRANHFRRNNEFDKAMGIYEQILNEDNTDAEAYWSLVLCRYGIEYVEDPSSRKRVPTVNRAQFTSIFDDEDYKSALQYADEYQKDIYEQEATVINDIQKGILAISQKEEPFDVFICYKETDNNGRRTPDSVLATDLYHELTREGYKVFFSRITLEDKLGTAYEPYIFAALNSAKVMVALGTKPEYFNAVWVKNEWSRYLALIKNGARKTLIPAYRNMDPYDLPEEFSHLQAQDMSKLGFMQDLIRGIKKIVGTEESKSTVNNTPVESGVNTSALLKRAFIFLEDRDWENADNYLEKILDAAPENAMAYLGKLMLQLHISKQEELPDLPMPFDDNSYYEKALRFADATLKDTLQNYITIINERNEHERLEAAYQDAKREMNSADDEDHYLVAANKFEAIPDYLNSLELSTKCQELAKTAHNEAIYQAACYEETLDTIDMASKVTNLYNAITKLNQIRGYKDSIDKISKLKLDIEELNRKIEIQKKRNKKIAIILSFVAAAIITFLVVLFSVIIPATKYNSANKHLKNKEYQSAYNTYATIKNYKDSYAKYQSSGYNYAQELMTDKKYQEAMDVFDSIGDYKKTADLKNNCYLEGAKQFYTNKDYYSAIKWYEEVKSYDKNADFYTDSCYNYAVQEIKSGNYVVALTYLNKAGNHSGVSEQINAAKYGYVKASNNRNDNTTFEYLKELKSAGYKDSASIYKELYAWKLTAIVNTDADDSTTDKSSISKYDSFYFHFDLQGGTPNEEIRIKYHITYPNGETASSTWDQDYVSGGLGDWPWEGGIYENPAFGVSGTLKAKFYNAKTGELIGEKSFKITG